MMDMLDTKFSSSKENSYVTLVESGKLKYTNCLSNSLRLFVEGQVRQTYEEQLDLSEELALLKAVCCRAVKSFSDKWEVLNDSPDCDVAKLEYNIAVATLSESITHIERVMTTMVKLRRDLASISLDPVALLSFAQQIQTAIIQTVGPNNQELLSKILSGVENVITIGSTQGVQDEPKQRLIELVKMMDSTIPVQDDTSLEDDFNMEEHKR